MKAMPIWSKEEPFGTELAEVEFREGALSANGIAVGTFAQSGGDVPLAYRLDYRLSTVERFVTARLVVQVRGNGWNRALDLRRLASGKWKCTTVAEGNVDLPPPGGDLSIVDGALDCDLALSPLTNTMPVLRHRSQESREPFEFVMALVSVPDLAVKRSVQRYAFTESTDDVLAVRFEEVDSAFVADLKFDSSGLVLEYPGLARRIA
ncbi:MAG TPA: putative glycolipid-binding domain-containing protein [Polyangiaceae bacterium]